MGRDKRNEARTEQFTKWILAHRLMPAWQALSFPAREAYFHLQVRCMAETAARKGNVKNNNGEVFRSPRDLAKDMGCNVKTAMSAIADLQAKGWIVCTTMWERGYDGRGRTALFRLTMLPTKNSAATRDPESWEEGCDYPVEVYGSYAKKPGKKQNPPPKTGALVNQELVHWLPKTHSSAPDTGALMPQNRQSSAPPTGAYLLAIPSEVMRASVAEGRGLCGKARIAA